jgi:hypothetical protein
MEVNKDEAIQAKGGSREKNIKLHFGRVNEIGTLAKPSSLLCRNSES